MLDDVDAVIGQGEHLTGRGKMAVRLSVGGSRGSAPP
jgi:hypothetical protein